MLQASCVMTARGGQLRVANGRMHTAVRHSQAAASVSAARRRCTIQAVAAQPPPPSLPRRSSHGVAPQQQRGPQPPASVAAPVAEAPSALTLPASSRTIKFKVTPRAPPLPYPTALEASICRTSLTTADLLETAASGPIDATVPHLRQQLDRLIAPAEPYQDTLQSEHGAAVEALLRQWRSDATKPAGFDIQCKLTVAGVADVAIASCGGRSRGQWKSSNQDSYLACPMASPSGTPTSLLLGVFDGHGCGGEAASLTTAGGLAGAVPALLKQLQADADASNDAASSATPVPQQALVRGFQAVAGSMLYDSDFQDCGSAAIACIVSKDSITAAWAGDCRAVVGLSVDTPAGPSLLVHSLTQDHKPSSPLERSRIESSAKGRVVQLRRGQPHRLCGSLDDSTLSLSRAFGDAWAVPLGLTSEPDAVTLTLPPAVPATTPAPSSPSCPLDSFVSGSIASGDVDDSAPPTSPVRHVLILGCDGLWDVLSNDSAVAIAMSSPSPEAAANALLHAAQRKWAATYAGSFADDVTVAVAFLPA